MDEMERRIREAITKVEISEFNQAARWIGFIATMIAIIVFFFMA